MRVAFLCVALTSSLFCQSEPKKTETPATKPIEEKKEEKKPETPPDQAALESARKIEDPAQKLAAFNEILTKFPKTTLKDGIRSEIFRATLKAHPTDHAAVLRTAKAYVKATSRSSRKYTYDSIAGSLLRADILLPEAEGYARKALKGYNQQQFNKDAISQAERAKRKPPTDDQLLFRYNNSRSYPLETLGLLMVKRGRPAEGRSLLEETLKWRPMAADANVAIAELEEKAANGDKALDHLLTAKLSGRMPKHGEPLLQRLYERRYGSMDSLESTLDTFYNKRFPSPLHVERYKAPEERSNRVVLAEMFTGAGCPPCASADLAFDAVLERYSRDEVALVVYHQHIPQPDPMAFPATRKRFEFYKRGGVPTYVIDGVKDGGGGPRETAGETYDKINPQIESRLKEKPSATIGLRATRNGDVVRVNADVAPISGDKRDLHLHIVLVEEMLRYTGENGIRFHPMVARSIAGTESEQGFAVEMDKPLVVEHDFEISKAVKEIKEHLDDYEVNGRHGKIQFSKKMHEIEPSKLAVIAFVQDASSSAILQSRFTQVVSQAASLK